MDCPPWLATDADAVLVPQALRRRRQQWLRPEGLRLPPAHRSSLSSRAHRRHLACPARPASLHRRRRGGRRRQRNHPRPSRPQASPDARRRAHPDATRSEPADHAPARRPLLGHVVLALAGRPLLACLSRRDVARASGADRGDPPARAGLQCAALPLPGHRPLPAGRRDGTRARRPGRAREGRSGDGLRPRRAPDEHRCRDLWVHRKHLLLRHRHAAEAFRRGARPPGAPLPRHPRSRQQNLRVPSATSRVTPVSRCMAPRFASARRVACESCAMALPHPIRSRPATSRAPTPTRSIDSNAGRRTRGSRCRPATPTRWSWPPRAREASRPAASSSCGDSIAEDSCSSPTTTARRRAISRRIHVPPCCSTGRRLTRQVRASGRASKLSAGESESYFRSRPRGHRLATWASPQSRVVQGREVLDRTFEDVAASLRNGAGLVDAPPAATPTYLDRVLAYLAPQCALHRQRAPAVLHFEATRADPERLRWIDGMPWTRIDGPPSAPERMHWEPLDTLAPPAAPPRWRSSGFWSPSERRTAIRGRTSENGAFCHPLANRAFVSAICFRRYNGRRPR